MIELPTRIHFDPKDLTRKHKEQRSWKRVVLCETDCDVEGYYAWFLQKRFNLKLNAPMRGAHITIVNDKVPDIQLFDQMREIFHNKELIFKFDPAEIRTNVRHWWIRVHCDDVANIRTVLGLDAKPHFGLHMTIGMVNDKNLFHSQYIHDTIMRYGL